MKEQIIDICVGISMILIVSSLCFGVLRNCDDEQKLVKICIEKGLDKNCRANK